MEKTELRDLACEPTSTLYVTNNLKGIRINAKNLVIWYHKKVIYLFYYFIL